jgi:5'-nucleotidase / UDP-sugar diphosphatase
MKKYFVVLLSLFISFHIFSADNPLEVTLFFTNDTNGHPLSFKYNGFDGQGGIPARAALIKNIVKTKKIAFNNYLILDAGGIIRGREESNLYNGLTDITGMNSAGYFAAGVGVSELYGGAKNFVDLNSKAKFYFLSSNLKAVNQKNPEICDRFAIKKVGNLKIGIFSVITENILKEMPEGARKDFAISNPIDTAKQIVKELKSEKNNVDIIIALTYLGYYPDDSSVGSKALAEAVEGIDLIIDGRTGLKLDEPAAAGNTKIVQAYKWGLFLGEINIKMADKKIQEIKYAIHPVNTKSEEGKLLGTAIQDDFIVLSAIKGKMQNMEATLVKELVKLSAKMETKDSNIKETEIGDLICDSMIDYAKADIAFQNAGGISSGTLENMINRKNITGILKYDNPLFVYSLKGSDIIRILEYGIRSSGTGGFLQVGGLRFEYSKSGGKITKAEIKGKPVEANTFYNVAVSSWLSDGMDGYEIFKSIPDKINLNVVHREAIYQYLEKNKNITLKTDGRIKIID